MHEFSILVRMQPLKQLSPKAFPMLPVVEVKKDILDQIVEGRANDCLLWIQKLVTLHEQL